MNESVPPWMVAIVRYRTGETKPFMVVGAGVMVRPCWFLTAAHVPMSINTTTAVVGCNTLLDAPLACQYRIDKVKFFHSMPVAGDIENTIHDAALVHLSRPVTGIDQQKQPVPFATSGLPDHREPLEVFGWGETSHRALDYAHEMKRIKVLYDSVQDERIFTKTPLNERQGACYGDSGGPLLRKRTDGTYEQFGIASSVRVAGNCSLGDDEYLRTTPELDWWIQHMCDDVVDKSVGSSTEAFIR
ncbi:MAG TPA: trypsin-like serine protease [Thermoanaerobaculia bacterium]|nr:trypsin-like serine protease [Thermoanaerobaculia bacterium]